MGLERSDNERGMGRAATIFLLLIFGAVVYTGFQVFPFFYYYEEIQGTLESQAAKAQVFTDFQIRSTIWERVRELQIPLDEKDDIQINRVNGKIVIDFTYQEVFYIELFGKTYDIYVFQFNPHVERQM